LSFHGIEEILIKVHVKVGQRVKKGDLLFEIDHTRSGARKDQAEVAYERAKQMQKAGAATAMDLKEARSAYDIARRDYEDTFIRAPKDGYVSQIDRKVGEMVGRDISGPIAVLVSSQDKLYLETGVIESQVARVKADQKVEVLIESLGPPALEGRVTGVSREVTTTGRTGTVMVGLPAAVQAKLRPGLSATCRILTFNGQALVIPRQSFDKEKGGVYVIADGKAVFRPVTLGYVAPDYYEAAQGLAEGERIVRDLIINPVEDGAAVTVEGEPERYAAEKAAGS
jgi:RND family efflux transporter MFP subunit